MLAERPAAIDDSGAFDRNVNLATNECGSFRMRRIPLLLFFGALLLAGYVAGSATNDGRKLLAAARTAIDGAWRASRPSEWPGRQGEIRGFIGRVVEVPAGDAAVRRVRLFAPTLAGGVLIAGGRHRFLDRCPGFVGCAAVEYDRHGRFVHAYPFRPEAYEAAKVPHGLAEPVRYEQAIGFDFAKHADVFAIDSYSNGDLAVALHSRLSFPPDLGIARIDRAGRPRWFRIAGGSHHWQTVTHGRLRGVGAGLSDGLVTASRRVGTGWPRGIRESNWGRQMGRGTCRQHFVDYLHVIDGDGALLRQIAVAEAVRDSRHAPLLAYSYNACDPLHLNSVDVLAAAGPWGLAAGDFLVSLRNIGALAVLDGEDGRLKRIWRGSFYGQHGARALAGPGGPTFLMFDNWGVNEVHHRPGRLLALEADSGRERTIFPNASTPAAVRLRSRTRGGVSIAPDGSRAIVHAHASGQAVEVDLANGEATAVFQIFDDVSTHTSAAGASNQAFLWHMRDIRYVAVR